MIGLLETGDLLLMMIRFCWPASTDIYSQPSLQAALYMPVSYTHTPSGVTEEEFLAVHPEGVEAHIKRLAENAEPGRCADCSFVEMCKSANC